MDTGNVPIPSAHPTRRSRLLPNASVASLSWRATLLATLPPFVVLSLGRSGDFKVSALIHLFSDRFVKSYFAVVAYVVPIVLGLWVLSILAAWRRSRRLPVWSVSLWAPLYLGGITAIFFGSSLLMTLLRDRFAQSYDTVMAYIAPFVLGLWMLSILAAWRHSRRLPVWRVNRRSLLGYFLLFLPIFLVQAYYQSGWGAASLEYQPAYADMVTGLLWWSGSLVAIMFLVVRIQRHLGAPLGLAWLLLVGILVLQGIEMADYAQSNSQSAIELLFLSSLFMRQFLLFVLAPIVVGWYLTRTYGSAVAVSGLYILFLLIDIGWDGDLSIYGRQSPPLVQHLLIALFGLLVYLVAPIGALRATTRYRRLAWLWVPVAIALFGTINIMPAFQLLFPGQPSPVFRWNIALGGWFLCYGFVTLLLQCRGEGERCTEQETQTDTSPVLRERARAG